MKGSDDRAGSPNNAAKELATAPEVGLRFWHDLPILNEAGADVPVPSPPEDHSVVRQAILSQTRTQLCRGDPYGQTRIGS